MTSTFCRSAFAEVSTWDLQTLCITSLIRTFTVHPVHPQWLSITKIGPALTVAKALRQRILVIFKWALFVKILQINDVLTTLQTYSQLWPTVEHSNTEALNSELLNWSNIMCTTRSKVDFARTVLYLDFTRRLWADHWAHVLSRSHAKATFVLWRGYLLYIHMYSRGRSHMLFKTVNYARVMLQKTVNYARIMLF